MSAASGGRGCDGLARRSPIGDPLRARALPYCLQLLSLVAIERDRSGVRMAMSQRGLNLLYFLALLAVLGTCCLLLDLSGWI